MDPSTQPPMNNHPCSLTAAETLKDTLGMHHTYANPNAPSHLLVLSHICVAGVHWDAVAGGVRIHRLVITCVCVARHQQPEGEPDRRLLPHYMCACWQLPTHSVGTDVLLRTSVAAASSSTVDHTLHRQEG